jgi:Ca-activated chloride channel homolog
MIGIRISEHLPQPNNSTFDTLLDIFKELLMHTSGDFAEAMEWLTEIDKQHKITTEKYGIGDFINELQEKGYIQKNDETGTFDVSSKTNQSIRQSALEQIFGKLKKTKKGNHFTPHTGQGDEKNETLKEFTFGDSPQQLAIAETINNAYIKNGIDEFVLHESDLMVHETEHKSQTSTVLMIDISHSMILYGEDRITPAKKVAMALSELILKKYKKDTLDIIVFGNEAWQIDIKELPYLQVGPYHTNTVAGLELAMEILRKRKNNNKQIFMITDGKPTCLKINGEYYQNSFGLDRKIINQTLHKASACRRLGINITTFMIAKDPYLIQFVEEFTETNNGKAFYTSLQDLGNYIFEDFEKNRRKNSRK